MASYHVPPLERLVDKFESLPGVGHKSAQRIAYAVLNMDKAVAESFAQAIIDAHEQIHYCSVCCNLTDGDLCPVCRDESRDTPVAVWILLRTYFSVVFGTICPENIIHLR